MTLTQLINQLYADLSSEQRKQIIDVYAQFYSPTKQLPAPIVKAMLSAEKDFKAMGLRMI